MMMVTYMCANYHRLSVVLPEVDHKHINNLINGSEITQSQQKGKETGRYLDVYCIYKWHLC